MRRAARAALLCALAAAPARAAETALSARLLGGRLLTDGRQGSFSGSAQGDVAAAVPLGERWTLFPAAAASWSGVQSAMEVPGGATLFQESMEDRARLKAVYQPAQGRWRLKPWAGWRAELLKETKDEAWFHGLFDHHTVDAGLEGELAARGGASFSLAYSFSRTLWPNYSSLESSAPADPFGRPLARELSGARVLDWDAHMLAAGVRVPLGGGTEASGRLAFQRRGYLEQHLVRADGLLDAGTRGDAVTTAEASLKAAREPRPDLRVAGSLALGFEDAISDQASFDPASARYEPRHYNYTEWSVGPELSLLAGDPRAPESLSLAARYARRSWPHRSARDGGGVYLGAGLVQQDVSVSAEGRWPLAPGLALLARVERSWARANDHYAAAARFNFDAASFLFGIALER